VLGAETWTVMGGRVLGPAPFLLAGIINATPDSFYDGGRHVAPAAAVLQGRRLIDDGAHILDVGGESTRPGALEVSEAEELARVVPVIRDVDQKGLIEIARELGALSTKAREKKITPGEMQGGCFTISSLGGIGGTYFTPIINLPEVAILGVSRASMKPVWNGQEFEPRLMLPLSLSYDHRVIDGALGARFSAFLCNMLGDVRRLLL